jgi:drug/metabolite transporter (DMT)-like permease
MNYMILILTSIIAIMPVLLVKQYIKKKNIIILLIAFLAYVFMTYGYYLLFLNPDKDSSIIFTILLLIKILIIFFVCLLFLKETANIQKVFGTLFAIMSIYLLNK